MGLWEQMLAFFRDCFSDEEYLMIDGSGVRVHQDAARTSQAQYT